MKRLSVIQRFGVFTGLFIVLSAAGVIWLKSGKPAPSVAAKPVIAASFYPLYDMTRTIGGEDVTVTSITPSGAEPHDFEPAADQLAAINQAAGFVYVGGVLEPWADKYAATQPTRLLQILPDATDDAHFWLDPQLVAEDVVPKITTLLQMIDPANATVYASRANQYVGDLKQLDADFKSGLAQCRSRTIITSHDAFRYLAKRYNLEEVPIAGVSPEAEPDAASLAELTALVKEKAVTTIFFETLVSSRLADTIAKETGAQTAVLDPIEGIANEDQSQTSYIDLQRSNLDSLRRGLACQ